MTDGEKSDTKPCGLRQLWSKNLKYPDTRVAADMSTSSVSSGTADVHSSKMAYYQKRLSSSKIIEQGSQP